ncbi:hypothetical protein K6Y31_15200 [Motilimonas cestriensis]|uniref:Uncharacterized protein n=1 Tax=Motilimonas cestriensis TaxID=2742685 RepID=A0ABS8WAU5_9GAMM|nr:hypothetical protein [Motilimonas cestriensis]MCE2596159.1 hypothetical protein [Motilimonas cestriensis]
MTEQILTWMQALAREHEGELHGCAVLQPYLKGYFPEPYLQQTAFMVVDTLPLPNLTGLKGMLAQQFMPKDLRSIAYAHGYYILREHADDWSLHCRELVHLAQWQHLGAEGFLQQLYQQIKSDGYQQASLVKMADAVVGHFNQDSELDNIPALIVQSLQAVES